MLERDNQKVDRGGDGHQDMQSNVSNLDTAQHVGQDRLRVSFHCYLEQDDLPTYDRIIFQMPGQSIYLARSLSRGCVDFLKLLETRTESG